MRTSLFIISILFSCSILSAQTSAPAKIVTGSHPYNVVFDMTSKDTVDHKMVLRWVNEVLTANPNANVEVVFYAKSLDMVTKDKTTVADGIKKLSDKKNVAFKVCEVAMKNNNVTHDQLLAGIQTVPDGIYEIISKQQDGWGYIKVSH